jgi:hypothetical protein
MASSPWPLAVISTEISACLCQSTGNWQQKTSHLRPGPPAERLPRTQCRAGCSQWCTARAITCRYIMIVHDRAKSARLPVPGARMVLSCRIVDGKTASVTPRFRRLYVSWPPIVAFQCGQSLN